MSPITESHVNPMHPRCPITPRASSPALLSGTLASSQESSRVPPRGGLLKLGLPPSLIRSGDLRSAATHAIIRISLLTRGVGRARRRISISAREEGCVIVSACVKYRIILATYAAAPVVIVRVIKSRRAHRIFPPSKTRRDKSSALSQGRELYEYHSCTRVILARQLT